MTKIRTMRRIVLAGYPVGLPGEGDFRMEEVPVPECPARGLLVRTTCLSVDPYMRGRMSGMRTYVDPFALGAVVEGGAVGEVIASDAEGFAVGDSVVGMWGWQEYAAVEAGSVQKLNPEEAPVSTALGILGMPGMTAYFGFLEICQPKAGETVMVSGAAGAVGSAVGQIAKIKGCRVVGSAGSAEKVEYLKSLGFDGAFNYRTERPYGETLRRLCPNGIDCYFDNVGGALTDAVMERMNLFGRVSVCGQISMYNENPSADVGPRPFRQVLVRQLRVEGFIVSRWVKRWPEGRKEMAAWLREGKLQYEETVFEGIENTVKAFLGLFSGENTGKAIVKLG
jgi:NADPH-dependent curcumin reductase CurA